MNHELEPPFEDEPTDEPVVLEDDEMTEDELHERRQARQSGGFDVPMFGLS